MWGLDVCEGQEEIRYLHRAEMKVTFCKQGIDQCDREGGRQDPGAKSNMVILATRTAERASEIQHQGLTTQAAARREARRSAGWVAGERRLDIVKG